MAFSVSKVDCKLNLNVQFCILMIMIIIAIKYAVHCEDIPQSLGKQFDLTNYISNQIQEISKTPATDYNNTYFRYGSKYCDEKAICTKDTKETFPTKVCHCDNLCELMNDCCNNYGYTSKPMFKKEQFKCMPLHEIVKNSVYGVLLVAKCSSKWKDDFTRELCEADSDEHDTFLRLPVSDKTEFHVMFKNMYCAHCNFVDDFYYWKHEIQCKNDTGVRTVPKMKDCYNQFTRPMPDYSYRTCQLSQPIISRCNLSSVITTFDLMKRCEDGIFAVSYDDSGTIYRNKYCALCNGVNKHSLFCEYLDDNTIIPDTDIHRFSYSLKLIVNINTGKVYRNGKEEDVELCEENEIYVNHFQKCREIYCVQPFIPFKGKCTKKGSNGLRNQEMIQKNCTFIKVESSEYEIRNNSELYIFSLNQIYSADKYYIKEKSIYICVNETETCVKKCKTGENMYYSDIVESYLTFLCLVLSIMSLAVTLAVYVAFPQLLNVPGKLLVSLIISLLFAQILFLLASEVQNRHYVCILVGVLVHYFFLAAFCWMNVIAFDLWMTFSNRFMTPGSDRKEHKRFIRYSIYAWLLPLIIVCTAVLLDFANFDVKLHTFKPGYGENVCWISSIDALIIFFAGPLAVFKLFDVISFISTAFHIARAKKEGAVASRQKNTCSFILNIELSLIMGLTWVFAFIANALNKSYMWYLFIIFNSLQGLFIAICFLCTKVVRDACRQATARNTSGTQITEVP